MKTVLRNGITVLLSVVLCMCFVSSAFAEGLTLSDAETYDAHGVYVNEENFPDDNFRQFVFKKYGSYLSSGEIASAKVIDCSNNHYWIVDPINPDSAQEQTNDEEVYIPPDSTEGEAFVVGAYGFSSDSESFYSDDGSGGIKSLKGIEYFTELEELYCARNALSVIDLSKNTALKHLDCSANKLLAIDLSGNEALSTLDCSQNQLTSLDLRRNEALTKLTCSNNRLTGLNLSSNVRLQSLNCAYNQLSNLVLSNSAALTTIDCSDNQLYELDLSSNSALSMLICCHNKLTTLDLRANLFLGSIDCQSNSIVEINLNDKPQLRMLNCTDNLIAYLNIEKCPRLLKLTAEKEPENVENTSILFYTNFSGEYSDSFDYMLNGIESLTVDQTVKLIPVNCHAINETDFPDANFRAYIAETFDTDGDLYLCKDEIEAAIEIDCAGLGIHSLKGLEFFCNLKKLNCSDNNIEYFTICESADLLALIDRVQPEVTENHVSYTDADAYLVYDTDTILMDAVQPKGIINKANFPDTIFRDYVSNKIDLDSNGFLSDEEIAAVTWIDCSGNGEDRGSIESLQGVELFPNLELLDCSYNRLWALDVSKNKELKTLDCSTNYLEGYLDVTSNTSLETLWCYSNRLEDIDLGSNANLLELWCNDNQLSLLDISGLPGLKVLWCDANNLTELDTTENIALETLCCANNSLENLNLSQNPALTTLWCFNNRITELKLFNNPNLKKLGWYNSRLGLDPFIFPNITSELDISYCPELCKLVSTRPSSVRDGVVYYFDESSSDPVYLQYDIGVTLITSHTPDLILPSSLTAIEDEAFRGGAFSYVVLPEGAESIGSRAFADCPKLAYIYIPASVASIDENAFDGVEDLTIFGAPDSDASEYASLHGFTFAAQ